MDIFSVSFLTTLKMKLRICNPITLMLWNFPPFFFFEPKLFLRISKESKVVERIGDIHIDEKSLFAIEPKQHPQSEVHLRPRISKEKYLEDVESLRQHIKLGDIYEVNYCQEFYDDNATINPAKVFNQLSEYSEAPFQSFFKASDKYAICGSPERYIKKSGKKIISQPIKGTAKRSVDSAEDNALKDDLFNSIKERAENVMIVDLVRNDLSKTAKKGSVKVDELFGIYSFKSVHQMISTVSSELRENCNIIDPIQYSFPVGSMTGAPKVRAMQLIEEYESTKRGLYSGSIGYISPEGDYDFNVVIRTILYNQSAQYISAMVGGAITFQSDPEKEYEECLTKVQPIFDTFKE